MLRSGRLLRNITRTAINLNRPQIRLKTQDIVSWKMKSLARDAPFIVVKSPYSVKIEPLDPIEYISNGNTDIQAVKGNLYLETDGEEDLTTFLKNAFQEDINFNVKPDISCSASRDYFEVTCSEQQKFQYPSRDITLKFQVPARCSVVINVTGHANVDVRDLEGGPFEILTDQGTCQMKSLKGSTLKAKTSGGDIICKSQLLFEHGFIETKMKGKIFVKKLQGKEFLLETEYGNVDVGATYAVKAALTSKSGSIKLGDIHGMTEVNAEDGDILISSTSGQLNALTRRGHMDVSLSQHDDVMLETEEGDINIKFLEESVSSELYVKSKHIDIDSNVNVVIEEEDVEENFTVITGKVNPKGNNDVGKRTIKAEAKLGTVKFEKKDWFSSLKLS